MIKMMISKKMIIKLLTILRMINLLKYKQRMHSRHTKRYKLNHYSLMKIITL